MNQCLLSNSDWNALHTQQNLRTTVIQKVNCKRGEHAETPIFESDESNNTRRTSYGRFLRTRCAARVNRDAPSPRQSQKIEFRADCFGNLRHVRGQKGERIHRWMMCNIETSEDNFLLQLERILIHTTIARHCRALKVKDITSIH